MLYEVITQEDVVAYIRKEGEIDAQRFKDLTGLTRKFSIPLLEYFDKIKLTIRPKGSSYHLVTLTMFRPCHQSFMFRLATTIARCAAPRA